MYAFTPLDSLALPAAFLRSRPEFTAMVLEYWQILTPDGFGESDFNLIS
jgi:hypothetical protein